MSITTTSGGKATSDIVATLQREQANAMVQYQNIKKYHWATFGPLFRDIHLLFDEQADAWIDMVDEFAERAYIIDGRSIGDPADYLQRTTVRPSVGELGLRAMVEEAVANAELVIGEMHADAEIATRQGDIGTADLYTRLVQVVQKQRWFLREILRKGDGLAT